MKNTRRKLLISVLALALVVTAGVFIFETSFMSVNQDATSTTETAEEIKDQDDFVLELADETDRQIKEEVELITAGKKEDVKKENKNEEIVSALISNKFGNITQTSTTHVSNKDPEKPFDLENPDEFASGSVEFADNTILIKMKSSFDGRLTKELQNAGVGRLEVLFDIEGYTWYTAYLYVDVDVQEAMQAVRACSTTVVAEYNYKSQTSAETDNAGGIRPVSSRQWHMKNYGIPEAWKYLDKNNVLAGGKSSVVVAVIDTGVDYEHPALKANMWKNTAEIPDNGIDDDKNGYVDDYYGFNAYENKGSGDDDQGHGTHVAGIIAANPTNKSDMTGIAYNAKIMAIKASDSSGYFLQSNIVKAINYAFDNGADVINMSFGGSANSVAVADALARAYSRCVLVASAGNNGLINEAIPNGPYKTLPNYPAALSYVIGVMSVGTTNIESGFTNYDGEIDTRIEYEVYAPGENILSTLPGGRYASLSGTSMAAPVVSAQAALLRSMYADRNTYPSKFIYGQIIGTTDGSVSCLDSDIHGRHNIPGVINFEKSLTQMPKPNLGIADCTIFDTAGFKADEDRLTAGCDKINNGDGIADAGETLAVGFSIKNRWGMAEDTVVSVNVTNDLGMTNPYVTILNNDINYGSVGTYSEKDCGKIMENDMWKGWENPFYIKISPEIPNDSIITLNFTIRAKNALDTNDSNLYSFESSVEIPVKSGITLTGAITEDMTLTKDNLYIIPNGVTVMEGATLTIEPGTKIQFWTNNPQDAYAESGIAYIEVRGKLIAKGTSDEHIRMYPSELMSNYIVNLKKSVTGQINLEYTDITNCYIYYNSNSIDYAKNCNFTVNNIDSWLYTKFLSEGMVVTEYEYEQRLAIDLADNCSLYKSSRNSKLYLNGKYNNCAFIELKYACYELGSIFTECLFYGCEGGNFTIMEGGFVPTVKKIIRDAEAGKGYIITELNRPGPAKEFLDHAKDFSGYLDGRLAVFKCSEDFDKFIKPFEENDKIYFTGAISHETGYINQDGSIFDVDYSFVEERYDSPLCKVNNNYEVVTAIGNTACQFFIEVDLPTEVTDITLGEYVTVIGVGDTYEITPLIKPEWAQSSALVFESENPEIAKVSDNGTVTAVAPGTTNIKIYSSDMAVYNYLTVNVSDSVSVENIEVTEENINLEVDTFTRAKVQFTPKYTTERKLTYASSAPEIAKVNEKGIITAIAPGDAVITITAENGATANVNVHTYIKATEMSFKDAFYSTTLTKDDGTAFYPRFKPDNVTDRELIWQSSDPSVCYVDDEGKLVKLKEGIAALKVTNPITGLTDSINISITAIGLEDRIVDVCLTGYYGEVDKYYGLTENGKVISWGGVDYAMSPTEICNVKSIGGSNDGYALLNNGDLVNLKTGNPEVTGKGFEYLSEYLYYWEDTMYAIDKAGLIYAFGNNTHGQLGNGTKSSEGGYTFTNIQDNIKKIVPFEYSTLFLSETGDVYFTGGYNIQQTNPIVIFRGATDIRRDTYDRSGAIIEGEESAYTVSAHAGDIDSLIVCTYAKSNKEEKIGSSIRYYIENGFVYIKGTGNRSVNTYGELGIGKITSNECYDNKYYQMKNIDNVTDMFDFGENKIIVTADNNLYVTGKGENHPTATSSTSNCLVPTKIMLNPTPEDTRVKLLDTNIGEGNLFDEEVVVLEFNTELMSAPNYPAISIVDSDGNTVGSTKSIDFNKVIITPRESLLPNQEYTVSIPDNALKNLYGNVYTANTIPFRTTRLESYRTNLVVDDTGEIGDALNDLTLNIEFVGGRVKANDLTDIRLISDGTSVEFTATIENNILTITPVRGQLVNGAQFTLTIPSNTVVTNFGQTNSEIVKAFIYQADEEMTTPEPEEPEIIESEGSIFDDIDFDVIHNVVIDEELMNNRETEFSDKVMEAWNKYAALGKNFRFYSNAIINRLNNDDVNTWLRIQAPTSSEYTAINLGQNYWGTTNKELVEKQIVDFDDFGTLADINVDNILTTAPETVWPFVVDAYLTVDGKQASVVGNEEVTFVVEFNRDMDTSVELNVAFGSKEPFNDYTVDGSYKTPRQWQGTVTLTTLIENGYQYFSVSNGKAADADMTLFRDWGRFPFQIDTSSAQALIMQAEATEEGIRLTWQQDDFDTLSGYNVYRSDAEDGFYTRLNKTIIAPDTKEFFDDTVEPGHVYYYNFTVVKTDLTESEPSGKVTARSYDNMAPNVYHTPVYYAFEDANLVISATVTDNVGVNSAKVFYRTIGTEEWSSVDMMPNNDKYSAIIDAENLALAGLEYYIEATDGNSYTYKGTPENPYQVTIREGFDERSLGDVDGNGLIEIKDAMMLLMAINDRLNLDDQQFERADINDNGILEAVEALRIMQYVNGSISSIAF